MRKKNLILIIIAFFTLSFCDSKTEYLPGTLYGLERSRKLTGREAEEFVNRLHFNKVTNAENRIGFYEGKPGRLTIYLTLYENDTIAKSDKDRMIKKISPSNSVFSPVMFMKHHGKMIGYTFGMGQKHFIFSHNNLLFWISVEKSWADNFLDYYFEYVLKL